MSRRLPFPILASLLLAACAVAPIGAQQPAASSAPSPATPSALSLATPSAPMSATSSAMPASRAFAYRIDPVIAGRYGVRQEVAWTDTGAGRRPGIYLLGVQRVEFEADATPADHARFEAEFGATLGRPVVIPAAPDGSISARTTNNYDVTFDPARTSLEGFVELGAELMPGGSLVFSSEAAAKVMFQILRIRKRAPEFKVRFMGVNGMGCIPEDCGPDGGPTPVYPSVAPRPLPTPTPTPELAPMTLLDFDCDGPRPLGKLGVVKVRASIADGCWEPLEVKATLDEETLVVRLEGVQKRVATTCARLASTPEVYATFVPNRPGRYTVIGTVSPPDGGAVREHRCELEIVEGLGVK